MKIIELVNNLTIPITNEESDVLGRFYDKKQILRKDLNEREVAVANSLVNKDVLVRRNQNGQITYFKKTQS
jgi:hypothetical protein